MVETVGYENSDPIGSGLRLSAEISKVEMELVLRKIRLRNLKMEIGETEDSMRKEVEIEAKQTKDPSLSNADLRKIAVYERLIMVDSYTDKISEQLSLEEEIIVGEVKLRSLRREFIVLYGQNTMTI